MVDKSGVNTETMETTGELKNQEDVQRLLGEIENLRKRMEELKKELDKQTSLAKEYLDLAKRIQADFDNHKKRIVKEREEIIRCANENLICDLLPTVDDLERALSANCQPEELRTGLNHIYNNLMSLLHSYGLKEIPSDGKFNPEYHEAIAVEEGEEGKILEVYQKGYLLGSRVIRHSKVKVAKEKSGGDDNAKDNRN
ncbi:MAG: nucleotide exchange factor GrpE [Methanomassiliicoccales archaeon]|jgi:molecular chaperone GrpE|nr:nucleotide exchange factor GrpE [Methanomassiliicoccales archaeon]